MGPTNLGMQYATQARCQCGRPLVNLGQGKAWCPACRKQVNCLGTQTPQAQTRPRGNV